MRISQAGKFKGSVITDRISVRIQLLMCMCHDPVTLIVVKTVLFRNKGIKVLSP